MPLRGVIDAWVGDNEQATATDRSSLPCHAQFQTGFVERLQGTHGVDPGKPYIDASKLYIPTVAAGSPSLAPCVTSGTTTACDTVETGFSNAIVTPQRFKQHRALLTTSAALIVGGVLQNQDGVVSVKADRFTALEQVPVVASRDFH